MTLTLKPVPPRTTDETGNPYGILTVRGYLGKTKGGDSLWLCDCECGNTTVVARGDLRKKKGGTKSCGCGRKTQGGGHGTPEYGSWKEMKRRCYNPNYREYHLWGGRGIIVCDRWLEDFQAFLADMGPKPSPEHSVERLNNDGNYEPGNCRWATPKEQGANTRKAMLITFDGITDTLRGWARRIGVTKRTLSVRIKRWGLERALTTPPMESRQHQKAPNTTV